MTSADDTLATASRLREAREFLNLPRGFVANQLGIPEEDLEEIETGSRLITNDELEDFARLYRLSVAFIETGKDDADVGQTTEQAFLRAGGELSERERVNVERFALFLRNFQRG